MGIISLTSAFLARHIPLRLLERLNKTPFGPFHFRPLVAGEKFLDVAEEVSYLLQRTAVILVLRDDPLQRVGVVGQQTGVVGDGFLPDARLVPSPLLPRL